MPDEKAGIGSRVRHPQFGEGIITAVKVSTYIVNFMERGRLEIAKTYAGLEILEAVTPDEEMVSRTELEETLIKILRRWSDLHEKVELGNKWLGGKMILQPPDLNLKAKEIPIEMFFHKIVMIRDRLRVLEQHINSHKGLSDPEKIDLQQYITRIYGSLTTFNVLFKDKEDYFVGEKGSE